MNTQFKAQTKRNFGLNKKKYIKPIESKVYGKTKEQWRALANGRPRLHSGGGRKQSPANCPGTRAFYAKELNKKIASLAKKGIRPDVSQIVPLHRTLVDKIR